MSYTFFSRLYNVYLCSELYCNELAIDTNCFFNQKIIHMLQILSVIFLIIYTLIVIFIGVKNSHAKDSSDYFLASRKLPSWLLAVTFIASWWGGGSAIDLVDHAYTNGLSAFWIYGVPVLLSTLLMSYFAGKIRKAATISQPELFAKRYNETAALILTFFVLVFMVIGAAVQIIVIGHFFQSFFNISYVLGAVIGTSIVLFYSLFAGFKGVVLTDLLQFGFFLIGGIVLFVFTYLKSGGWDVVQSHAMMIGKEDYTSFWSRAPDYLAYVFTFGTSWTIQANVWQRISASKNERSARNMMFISFLVFIPLYLMVTFTGMFSVVLFDSLPEGGIIPQIIIQLDSPLLSALIFVGLCSAIMSTMDSMINTGALSLSVDIYQKHINKSATNKQNLFVARISTLIITLLALLIAVKIESVLTVSWIGADFLATGAFVPLIGGFIWKKGSNRAAIISMAFGFLFSIYNLIIAMGCPLPAVWSPSSVVQALVGMGVSLILYVTISLFDKRKRSICA